MAGREPGHRGVRRVRGSAPTDRVVIDESHAGEEISPVVIRGSASRRPVLSWHEAASTPVVRRQT